MANTTWLFGYGSLIWRQDFPVIGTRRASVEGWVRRLWQGSHDHRGTATRPGRVATLVPAAGQRCYGSAIRVCKDVFAHLDHREKNGYLRRDLPMTFDDGSVATGTTYLATADNPAFLGEADGAAIAAQVRTAAGESGANAEYVLELARALRRLQIEDAHIFEIEALLRHT